MQKTVYVLGAGFSMEYGAPSQSKLLEAMFELKNIEFQGGKIIVKKWVKDLEDFMEDGLKVSVNERNHYSLEDIYTPIDKSIIESISFRQYTPQQLFNLRDIINRLVIVALRSEIEKNANRKIATDKFARYVVENCKQRIADEKIDTVSIITTNWDTILDNNIYRIINADKIPKGHKFSGVLDYCCYISSLDENDDKIKPGIYALGKGRYNVKLLKLHGSLNWLQCPKCSRLFVKLYTNYLGGHVTSQKYCRHCEKNFGSKNDETNKLFTNLITPTFLKNLNNVQNKLVWQNAAIELSEASKVVFIGYSLPQADFEFKQVLSRMIRSNAEIEVFLVDQDNPVKFAGDDKYNTAGYRFQNFFSGRNPRIDYGGVKQFLKELP